MKIGIDARIWGTRHAGIGRYTEELVKNLQAIDKENNYVVFARKDDLENIPDATNWKKVVADVPHYSVKEQFTLPGILKKEELDLVHFTHLNVPLFCNRPFIVTIHDILWHQLQGAGVTTLPVPLYLIKHLGYRIVLRNAIKKSKKIIVPSRVVKSDVVNQFHIPESKVVVAYEGVSKSESRILNIESGILKKYDIKRPYLLYVGSLYPHKNVESVALAVKKLVPSATPPRSGVPAFPVPNLVVVCGRSVFWERFERFVKSNAAESFVKLIGHVSDAELGTLYKNAEAFVFPTLSEGFGLPGLEAMAVGTPVVCSDILVLHEVYGNAALYFNPKDPQDIADKIQQVLSDNKLRDRLVEAGKSQAVKYSWRKMAEQTLEVYKGSR